MPKKELDITNDFPASEDWNAQHLLGFRLPFLSNIWSRTSVRYFSRRFDLKDLESRVLFVIGTNKGVSLKSLGRSAGIDKAYASRTTTALVEAGLIKKNIDLEDRRSVRLELTKKGTVLYDAILRDSISRDDEWISVLDPGERANLHNYLDRLTKQAQKLALRERRERESES